MTKKIKNKYNQFTNKDIVEILKSGDLNKWEALFMIWYTKNKEAKNVVITFLLIVVIAFITKPEAPSFLQGVVAKVFTSVLGIIF